MKVSDFDYLLNTDLIAQYPIEHRDQSRLMVLNRKDRSIQHRYFCDIIEYLQPSDVLVLNETKVLPARLYGHKLAVDGKSLGAKAEFLLIRQNQPDVWEVMVKPGRKLRPGDTVVFGTEDSTVGRQSPENPQDIAEQKGHNSLDDREDWLLTAEILSSTADGQRIVRFKYQGIFETVLSQLGEMPLPPYIKEKLQQQDRYQTVYARENGSAAAPTAGLHFTPELLTQIQARGTKIAKIVLHVGIGTFRPVKTEEITEHKMHTEYYYISPENARLINQAKEKGGRVVAVGTTSTRCLESVADEKGLIRSCSGWTDIFIYPGYRFKTIDALITNFHLPKSTLLMLVSALADREFIMQAYAQAQELQYRFFSFGDAMLIQ